MMAPHADVRFAFRVEGHDTGTFDVVGFVGEESLSSLYRFEVTLRAGESGIDLASLIGKPAHLEISTFGDVRVTHGVLAEARYAGEHPRAGAQYRVVLVPRLWMLTLSRQNQIYGCESEQSVVDILAAEMTGDGMRGPEEAVGAGLTEADYELRLTDEYPQRDYTTQYEETDFAFVSRLLEAQGIFYFFEHGTEKDVAVFADHNTAFPDLDGHDGLSFRPSGGMVRKEPSILRLGGASRPLPAKILLKDYNYRVPRVSLQTEAVVDADGQGVVERYGDHFRTRDAGLRLARIRAEALRCRKLVLSGTSDCAVLEAGRRFVLRDHPSALYDQKRLLVERVTHRGWDPRFGGEPPADAAGEVGGPGYVNRFELLDATLPYRPAERTAKPVAMSLMNAHIDASGDGERAELDADGRYKVAVGWDLSDAPDGKASRPMRLMEPYGGTRHGMHFPLLKGTEVVLSTVGGDPDRPVILGAVPNPVQPSVVTSANPDANRILTPSGIELELNDGAVVSVLDSDAVVGSGSWAKLAVVDYDDAGSDSTLWLGTYDGSVAADSVPGIGTVGDVVGGDYGYDGIVAVTDGSETRISSGRTGTTGVRAESIGGDVTVVVAGDAADSIGGSRSATVGYGTGGTPADSLTVSGDRTIVVGSGDSGGGYSETVSGSYSAEVAGNYSVTASDRATYKYKSSSYYAQACTLTAYDDVYRFYLDFDLSFYIGLRTKISVQGEDSCWVFSIRAALAIIWIETVRFEYIIGWGNILGGIKKGVVKVGTVSGALIKAGVVSLWNGIVAASG